MSAKLNSWLRTFFTLNKSEQRGIIVLVVLIVLIGLLNILLPLILPKAKSDFSTHQEKIDEFLTEQKRLSDSADKSRLKPFESDYDAAKKKLTPRIFDPNNLSVEDWRSLGFTDDQIRTIKNYEEKGGTFRRREDLKKIFTISEYEYEVIEPYIVIPNEDNTISLSSVELNSCSSNELIKSLQLSQSLAERTVKFRELLGGFHDKEQMKEVYGLSNETYEIISEYLSVNIDLIRKIDINNIEFKELIAHPYFDYQLTKSIIDVRNKIGKFDNIVDLKRIEGISDSTYNKVSYYLYIRPEKTN